MDTEKPKLTAWQLLGLVILIVVSLICMWGMYIRVTEGLMPTNLTQHVPWGLWVAVYIYFIGLSAGSFLLSTMIYVFGVKKMEPIGPLALTQAFICLTLGGLAIAVDLGHPERMLYVVSNGSRTSVLAWECYFYMFYAVIILAELWIVLRAPLARWASERRWGWQLYKLIAMGEEQPSASWTKKAHYWMFMLGVIGIPCAFGVHGGTGSIFAVVKARDFWFGGLFPIIFLISALVSGGGLLTFLTATFVDIPKEQKRELVMLLARLTMGILAFDIVLHSSELLVTFYGQIPEETGTWQTILYGPYFYVFWFLEVGLGMVIPVIIVAMPATGRSVKWLGFAGLCVVIGMIGTRLNIVIPALFFPVFEEWGDPRTQQYGTAFPENIRWSLGYHPSLNEYIVGAAVVVLGIWLFILAFRMLPLRGEIEKMEGLGGSH
ncbi:MAG TPA: NrfD/PsrC family molybdoenzyme membrane anchor subunit [bacterium]|jgi:molybdopterin-containing oxidoreductase family membrane subunit